MKFWEQPDFAEFLPYLRAVAAKDVRAGKHARLELATTAPWSIRIKALSFKGQCAGCGRPIDPFRSRIAPNSRSRGGNIYLAATCPLAINMGCARGRAASVAYDAIEALIARQHPAAPSKQEALL